MIDVITILIGFVVITGIYGYVGYRVTKNTIADAIENVPDTMEEILADPTIKKAFSILGKKGADSRAETKIVDDLATDMLGSPQLAGLRMGADMIGIDMDQYVEKHGALGTIQGLTQIAGMLGIDINQLLAGGLQQGSTGGGKTAYIQ